MALFSDTSFQYVMLCDTLSFARSFQLFFSPPKPPTMSICTSHNPALSDTIDKRIQIQFIIPYIVVQMKDVALCADRTDMCQYTLLHLHSHLVGNMSMENTNNRIMRDV